MRFMPVRVPERGHPIVRFLFDEVNRQRMPLVALHDRAGLGRDTMRAWKRSSPRIDNVEASLNAPGYRLAVEKVD